MSGPSPWVLTADDVERIEREFQEGQTKKEEPPKAPKKPVEGVGFVVLQDGDDEEIVTEGDYKKKMEDGAKSPDVEVRVSAQLHLAAMDAVKSLGLQYHGTWLKMNRGEKLTDEEIKSLSDCAYKVKEIIEAVSDMVVSTIAAVENVTTQHMIAEYFMMKFLNNREVSMRTQSKSKRKIKDLLAKIRDITK